VLVECVVEERVQERTPAPCITAFSANIGPRDGNSSGAC
jgi:hypothetical protein